MAAPKKFRARLEPNERGGATFTVPFDVKATFGKARAPVRVTIRGYEFTTTIAPMGGQSLIGVNKKHQAAGDIAPGRSYSVEVALDTSERTVEPPADLRAALRRSKGAAQAWKALSYTHQREHVEAIEGAKKPETRKRRVGRAVEMVLEHAAKKASKKPARKRR